MAKAKNKVINGEHSGYSIWISGDCLAVGTDNGWTQTMLHRIAKDTVSDYEVITEDKMKSASSTILRAGAGALVFGPVGLLAGVSGKNKGIYNVAIMFKNGKKSLIEIDEKLYKHLVKIMF